MGSVEAIFLRPAARLAVRSVDRAEAVAECGLEGDHAGGGKRQVTVLSLESWQDACAEFGRPLDPAVRRANVVVAGVDLAQSIGRTLRLGGATVEILGETRPCELMDDDGRLGLDAALRKDRRGGVFGAIVTSGTVQVGDDVAILARPDAD